LRRRLAIKDAQQGKLVDVNARLNSDVGSIRQALVAAKAKVEYLKRLE
jgi:hypothetical protein